MHRDPRHQTGFTLLELMLVVALAAVILGLGVPNFRLFMLNSRMTSAANDMLAALHTARTEAVKRHAQVVMCFSTNPEEDEPQCAGDGTQGWIVFVDDRDPAVTEANDNNGVPDADEPVLLAHAALPAAVSTSAMPANNDGYLAYNASGFARTTPAGVRFGGVVMCDERGNVGTSGADISAARGLIISTTGRPRVTRSVTEIENDASLGGCQ